MWLGMAARPRRTGPRCGARLTSRRQRGALRAGGKLIAELQPRVVKLDRNLIQDLDREPRQQKLVAIVVHLCHELGACVVAEGIETNGAYAAVRDSGARYW